MARNQGCGSGWYGWNPVFFTEGSDLVLNIQIQLGCSFFLDCVGSNFLACRIATLVPPSSLLVYYPFRFSLHSKKLLEIIPKSIKKTCAH